MSDPYDDPRAQNYDGANGDSLGNERDEQVIVYSAIAIALSLFLAWAVSRGSAISFPLGVNYWIVPVTIVIGAVVRKPVVFRAIPWLVFSLLVITLFYRSSVTTVASFVLTTVTLGVFACTGRLEEIVFPALHKTVTLKIGFTPTRQQGFKEPQQTNHWVSLLFILVAWIVTVYLTADFSWATRNWGFYERYQAGVSARYGLLAWAQQGIQLVLVVAFFFAAFQGVLLYLRTRSSSTVMGRLLLRHELWKWNGWEQRKIAKSLRNRE